MAEEDKPGEETQPEEKKKKSKKLLVILIGVAVLAGGAAAAGFFMMNKAEPSEAVATADDAQPQAPVGLVPLDTFLVNLRDPRGERYMKVTMRLTVEPVAVADEIAEDDLRLARIRDRILTVLMSRTFEELASPLGKESLRLELQTQVGSLLEDGEVRDVLFSEFVVQ